MTTLAAALFGLSLFGGFCSGLLGVGGAVVLIPLLLSVPPLLGLELLTMHAVAGITMIQVLVSSATAGLTHRRGGATHLPAILAIGIPMGAMSFVGAALSRHVPGIVLEAAFGVVTGVAFALLIKPSPGEDGAAAALSFNRLAGVASGGAIGFLSGMVGAGGGFVLVPVMTRLLKFPIKMAVGSSLGIVFIGALMGSIGKILTLQVDWEHLLPVVAGSIPASFLGAHVSRRLPVRVLRRILLGLVFAIFLKTAWGVAVQVA